MIETRNSAYSLLNTAKYLLSGIVRDADKIALFGSAKKKSSDNIDPAARVEPRSLLLTVKGDAGQRCLVCYYTWQAMILVS
ncbi:Uncharacterized protein TCM_001210 [Theobroma cacao]|uniref:Uncharacterized protein n=1 Tax=Theobroma cacao TaxID=3641 RepID=A0A061DI72_THECC|nr:Uncharacterized protein TCM_001210 [Theobroma cacao]